MLSGSCKKLFGLSLGIFTAGAAFSGLTVTAQATTLALELTLNEPDPTAFLNSPQDEFGAALDVDGNRYLIAAPNHIPDNGNGRGRVHLFDQTGTQFLNFSNPAPGGGDDGFGDSIALAGNRVAVGAPLDDDSPNCTGAFCGRVYLYDAGTGTLERTLDDPNPGQFNQFGSKVAMHGNRLLVSAQFDNGGAVYLYDANNGALLQTFNDPTPTGSDLFGNALVLDGDTVIIGAPQDSSGGEVHVFSAASGNLIRTINAPTPASGSRFGNALSLDGDQILIGAEGTEVDGDAFAGEAHLFTLDGDHLMSFSDPTPEQFTAFATSVALSNGLALIGQPSDNSQEAPNPDPFGSGSQIGQAYLFDASTGALLQILDDPTPSRMDNFGGAVALTEDRALIGARFDQSQGSDADPNDFLGQVHVYSVNSRVVPTPQSLTLLVAGALGLLLRLARARV
mgnify:CR=1 FL=1